jgi:hypothetical protein
VAAAFQAFRRVPTALSCTASSSWSHWIGFLNRPLSNNPSWIRSGVARLFLVQHTKNGGNIPDAHKIYQIAGKLTKWRLKYNIARLNPNIYPN